MRRRFISVFTAITLLMPLIGSSAVETKTDAPIGLGDYVSMGEYDTDGDGTAEPILWRCVAFEKVIGTDENGNPITDAASTSAEYKDGYLPLMLADRGICEKEFDANGSVTTGSHGRESDRDRFGSPYWADSNIRDWLNSSATAGNVTWSCGNAPSYKDEAGFLTNFNDMEKDLIKTATQKTLLDENDYNALPEDKRSGSVKMPDYKYMLSEVLPSYKNAYSELVTDKMFLLDVQQVQNVRDNYGEYFRLSFDYWIKSHRWGGVTVRPPQKVAPNDISYKSPYWDDILVRPAFYLNTESESLCGISSLSDAVHVMRYQKKISATPKRDGIKEHYYCTGCGKKSSDKNGATEIDVVIPAGTQLCGNIQLGDYVQMGTYDKNNDGTAEPILWRCVGFEKVIGTDESGNPIIDSAQSSSEPKDGYLPLLLADSWVCKKEVDAAGSGGSHDRDSNRVTYGSPYWADSNIRDWLNSSATAGNVTWSCGNAPSYKDEAGFLTNFTAEENAVIKAVTQKSILSEVDYGALPEDKRSGSENHIYNGDVLECPQNYSSAYSEQITDKIFLLDVQQSKNVYNNLGQYFYRGYVAYCLRTPHTYYQSNGAYDGSYCVRLVNSSSLGVAIQNAVPKNNFCLRPAFFLNLQSEIICGSGTEENPYTFVEHALTYHEGHEATCTEGGNSEYWTCDSNYRIYSDANAENELSKIPETAAGHSWDKWIISDNTAERVCTRDSSHTENQRVEISDIEAKAYTGDLIEPAITVNIGDITLVKDTNYTVEYRNNINVGAADAVIKFTGNYTGETSKIFTIEKATPTVVAPKAKLLTYNGTAQELVEAGSAAGGELQYSLSQDSGYSTDIPTAEHAGTYTVWYKIVGNDNYNDVAAESVEVTIYNAGQTPPVVNINYADETLSTAETMEYSKNGVDWLRCTDNMAIDTFGYNGESMEVYIRTAEIADKDASSTVKIIIPARPSAPSVKAGIGVIMNTTDAMEYRTENGAWINAGGDEITGLEAGVYEVRYKAASAAFASAAARVEVNPMSVPTATPDLSPSPMPTASASPTPAPTASVNPSPTPTASTRPTPTPTASASSTPKPTAKPTHGGSSSIRIPSKTILSPTPAATPSAKPDMPPAETDNPVNNWFVDVHKDAWYYDAVKYMFENGLMLGVSEMKFAPNENMTRGMFVTVLYRIEGEPEINSSVSFTDINGEYYADAVKWASGNKIIEGYTDEIFAPDKNITREQMAAIVYRYAAFKQYTTNTAGTLSYTDTADISDYAKNAVIWNIQNGIMFGNEDNTFSPGANTTRAQAAAVFERIIGILK